VQGVHETGSTPGQLQLQVAVIRFYPFSIRLVGIYLLVPEGVFVLQARRNTRNNVSGTDS
jgi:hypothetical protein